MASTFDSIISLMKNYCGIISRSPESWQEFLTCACNNYKLPIEQQILLYAQKPDATAVLEAQRWNKLFNRSIKENAEGISVLVAPQREQLKVKVFYDISDTIETETSKPVPIWHYSPEYEQTVINVLESVYGTLDRKDNIINAVFSASKNAVANSMELYNERLKYDVVGSYLEELELDTASYMLRITVQNSIAFMLLSRLGFDASEEFERLDFEHIVNFNTVDTIATVGLASSEIVSAGLSEIGKTILSLEKENRTFAKKSKPDYTDVEIKNERGAEYGTNQLHKDERSENTELDTAEKQGYNSGQMGRETQDIPDGKSQSVVSSVNNEGRAGQEIVTNSTGSTPDGTGFNGENGSTGRHNGGTQSQRYNDLGTANEQSGKPSSRNRNERGNLHSVKKELPPLLNNDAIAYILSNPDDDLKERKPDIVEFFVTHDNEADKIEYLRSIYPARYSLYRYDGEMFGYFPLENGLLMWEGNYLTRTKESVFSWSVVSEIISDAVDNHTYFTQEISIAPSEPAPKKTRKKAESSNLQYNLFDFVDDTADIEVESTVEEPAEPIEPATPKTVSIEYFNDILRGSEYDKAERERTAKYFNEHSDAKSRADYLKQKFGIGGQGELGFNEFHNAKGMTIKLGDLLNPSAELSISWKEAAILVDTMIANDTFFYESELNEGEINPDDSKEAVVYFEDAEVSALYKFLSAVKIDDITISKNDDDIICAVADDGYKWEGKEFYEFLLNDVLTFDNKGNLVEGYDIDNKTLQPVIDLAKKFNVRPHIPNEQTIPIWQEYTKIRADYPNTVIFFQLGDFYEVFADDAKILSREFDFVLTSRTINFETNERVAMCGVPKHRLDDLLSEMCKRGYRVAVANNITDGRAVHNYSIDNPPDPLLNKALDLILEYKKREFETDFDRDYQDLSNINLAHTTSDDEKTEIEADVDLVNYTLTQTVNGKITSQKKYDTLEALIDNELSGMSFDDLVYVDESALREPEPTPAPSDLIGIELTIDNMNFVIDSVENGYVSMRDKSFEGNVGFPVFRRETVEFVMPYIEQQTKAHTDDIVVDDKPKKKKKPTFSFDLHPDVNDSQRVNFDLANNEVEYLGKKGRFNRSIEAIKLLKTLENENRFATPDEQLILSKYVGWGGIPEAFDSNNSAWTDEYITLKSLLDESEYKLARESTLTAFYTPSVVISAMYKALDRLGFNQGNILEPCCAIGNFIGMLPEHLQDSSIYGIELDAISAGIAQQLYQKSSVLNSPFEKANIPDNFFDVVIGNVPFGDYKLSDKRYDKHNFLIHDYFFAKSLDKLRAGGIMLLVTSKGTMDKESKAVRRYIAQRADLLGAIRLPNNTFNGNAGTDVVSDILVLQKRDRIVELEPEWLELDYDEQGIQMNRYFIEHPEMVLGKMTMVSGRFGMEATCEPLENRTLNELLDDAIQKIEGQITEIYLDDVIEADDTIPATPDVRNYSYTLVDNKLYYRTNSVMAPAKVNATAEKRIRGLIEIRDCVRRLIELQSEDYPDDQIEAEQSKLNTLYDAFIAKYDYISKLGNRLAFEDDASYHLLVALEKFDKEGNYIGKADMFSKRTINPHIEVTSVDTSSEALTVSIGERAKIDIEYMMQLSGKSEEEIYNDLKGVIFLNPAYDEQTYSSSKYLMSDEYLSGNVRQKLRFARLIAKEKPEFEINVEALERVQPQDLTASEIDVRLGSTWVPEEIFEEFMYDLLNTPYNLRGAIRLNYISYTGKWLISNKTKDYPNVNADCAYGTFRINAYKIIEDTLNLKDVRIFDNVIDGNGKKKSVLNKKETAIAQSKQELIKQKFADWVWSDPERRNMLCKLYNEKFNSSRPREYDGSRINFVGMNAEISLLAHQRNGVAHILYGGNTLLAHAVGAGKTFLMVAAAMEAKRLGQCNKSLFIVPNHLTEQWADDFLLLYPSANILVARKKDFETKNRKRFCAKIATGEYDAVIIGHSQFEKIPMSVERQRQIIERQISEIMYGIEEAKREKGSGLTVKQFERTQKNLEAKLERLNDQSRKDDVVTFEELGIDRIFVDESHYYKNLFLYTKMRNVSGIAQTEAQKSSDMYMKTQYLDEITGGRGVVFATGTPISNSMVELYTIQRYLQYQTLCRHGLENFDAWASTFGETITAVELTPEGSGYRAKTKFAKFFNLPELMSMFKEIADIQTSDMLNLPVPDVEYNNIAVKPSETQQTMVEHLSERAERVRKGSVDADMDNMLCITNDGRKLALDQRLLDPSADDYEGSKVNACVNNVFDIWKRTMDNRSVQVVFCDLSTPKVFTEFDENGNAINPEFTDVYNDIKGKLIRLGIPADEIAFAHEAKTELQKADMFAKARAGTIRVLIGSTSKMGAGTNIQNKLIALHDLDCPWRPSDLEQRSGRIIRQGNENEKVYIYRYVTEQTFDAYLYQLVEGKQKFASQIMSSKSPVRSAEDFDEAVLSYAEIKMLATGNPYIKEKMDLDIQVQKLRMVKSNFLSQKYRLEDKILKGYPTKIAEAKEQITGLEKDAEIVSANPKLSTEEFSGLKINGIFCPTRSDVNTAILELCEAYDGNEIKVCDYRGFEIYIAGTEKKEYISIRGNLSYDCPRGLGVLTRIDTRIDKIIPTLDETRDKLSQLEKQLEMAKIEVVKPFAQEEELKQKEARLAELNALLNVDKSESTFVDVEPDEANKSVHSRNDREER